MSLQNRVARLEAGVNTGDTSGGCVCPGRAPEMRTYEGYAASDADQTPPQTCATCGGELKLVKLVIVETAEETRPSSDYRFTLNLGDTAEQ